MDWTEELRARTGICFRTTRPEEIEAASMETIREELGTDFVKRYPKNRLPVLCRVIHTTADFSYRDTLTFSDDALERASDAIRRGVPIVTDTTMAMSGINKRAAVRFGIDVHCLIADPAVADIARETGLTRSAVSVDEAAKRFDGCIYAVGNAPTALMRLYEHLEAGTFKPALIIGVPVGFVNVTEAKELILRTSCPYIIARGRKGGSNVAAAIVNALLYENGGR